MPHGSCHACAKEQKGAGSQHPLHARQCLTHASDMGGSRQTDAGGGAAPCPCPARPKHPSPSRGPWPGTLAPESPGTSTGTARFHRWAPRRGSAGCRHTTSLLTERGCAGRGSPRCSAMPWPGCRRLRDATQAALGAKWFRSNTINQHKPEGNSCGRFVLFFSNPWRNPHPIPITRIQPQRRTGSDARATL